MKIAVVHSFYSQHVPSGENSVVEQQQQLLADAGHEVRLFGKSTANEQSALFKARAGLRVATGIGVAPLSQLDAYRPDIVHIHNLFPNFSTKWVHRWRGPVVVSLHNYRAVCARGDLYRDGSHCEECVTRGSYRAVVNSCYRNSSLATIPVAVSRSSFQRDVLRAADAVVTTSSVSDAQIRRLIKPPLQTMLIPNPGSDAGVAPIAGSFRRGWLAMGRLSPEKGFVELVESWPATEPLDIIGSGPLAHQIDRAVAGTTVNRTESMPIDQLRTLLPHYLGMVFPSRWVEIAPQVVVEAMRVGLPVIALERNGISGLVESTATGVKYRDAESLKRALEVIKDDLDGFSSRAFAHYQHEWDPTLWLSSMTNLYQRLLSSGT